jgi:hypothetical protein
MGDSKQQGPRPRPAAAKGRRPKFLDDPDTDRLLAMVMALTGELAVLRERLDSHERLAAAGQVATPEAIEAFEPGLPLEESRNAWRTAMLQRVFRSIRSAESDTEAARTEEDWRSLMDEAASE